MLRRRVGHLVVQPCSIEAAQGYFLVQLCCHLSRHRGQLNYLRRILEGRDEAGVPGGTGRAPLG